MKLKFFFAAVIFTLSFQARADKASEQRLADTLASVQATCHKVNRDMKYDWVVKQMRDMTSDLIGQKAHLSTEKYQQLNDTYEARLQELADSELGGCKWLIEHPMEQ